MNPINAPKTSPFFYAIAGIPAAGKTSFRIKAIKSGVLPPHAFIHDCDAVMESLAGYQSQLAQEGPVAAFGTWELPARKIAEQELDTQIAAKCDIIYDRSCALPSSFEFIKDLVEIHGYKLIMHVLMIHPAEALRRATERQVNTGRHLPEHLIIARAQMLRTLWPQYLQLATEAYMHENSDFNHTIIAAFKDNKLTINDNQIYDKFIAQINI